MKKKRIYKHPYANRIRLLRFRVEFNRRMLGFIVAPFYRYQWEFPSILKYVSTVNFEFRMKLEEEIRRLLYSPWEKQDK